MKESLLYKILIRLDKIFIKIYRPTYIGVENIPKEGPIILAGNHTSKMDPLLLVSSTNRCIHFLAKIELFKGIKKVFFTSLGIIPVDRKRKNPESVEIQGFLLAIHDLYIDGFAIGRPSGIGEIAFGSEVGDVEIDSLVLRYVVYAEFEAFGWHTDHWVFDVASGASASCDVEEGEGGDMGFVFDIEGQATIVGRWEDALHASEFVARNGLSADDVGVGELCDRNFDAIGSEP